MADRAFRAFLHPHMASDGDFLAMLKLAAQPKLVNGATFTIPTVAQITHEDDMRLFLQSTLLAADVRTPRVSVSFDPEAMTFSFTLELSNCRVAKEVIHVRAVALDDGFFPCFDLCHDLLARESCRSLLFKFWP